MSATFKFNYESIVAVPLIVSRRFTLRPFGWTLNTSMYPSCVPSKRTHNYKPSMKVGFSVAGSAKWKNLTVHVRDIGNRDLRIVFSFESNRPYTTQAVTQPNGLQAYRTACYRAIIWTCLFQFSHKTRQTMLLYAYFTPKVDFKRKFNHHPSFLYEWRLTAQTIQKFRIGPSIRIESRIGRTIRNRITSRSFAGP